MTGARSPRSVAAGVLALTAVALVARGGVVEPGPAAAVAVAGLALSAAAVGVVRARQGAAPVEEERHARPHLPGGGPGDAGRRRALVLAGAAALVLSAGALRWLLGASRRAERALSSTAWRPGVPLVDEQGRRLSASSGSPGTVVTVWPEGHLGDDNAQAVLVHLGPGEAVTGPGRQEWTASGFVAYSRLCTHMGCPVALYQVEANVLVCPCHQATFDVLRGARPVLGPARRPLPQLPLAVDGAEGVLVAGGDFSAPVGPGYWGRGR